MLKTAMFMTWKCNYLKNHSSLFSTQYWREGYVNPDSYTVLHKLTQTLSTVLPVWDCIYQEAPTSKIDQFSCDFHRRWAM